MLLSVNWKGTNTQQHTFTYTHVIRSTERAVNAWGVLFSLISVRSSSSSTHRLALSIRKPNYCLQSKTNIPFPWKFVCLRMCAARQWDTEPNKWSIKYGSCILGETQLICRMYLYKYVVWPTWLTCSNTFPIQTALCWTICAVLKYAIINHHTKHVSFPVQTHFPSSLRHLQGIVRFYCLAVSSTLNMSQYALTKGSLLW